MWIRSILTVALGLLLVAPARAQTEVPATARVSIDVDALGSDVRHRHLEFRGLAGSMRTLAERSAIEDSDWLARAAARVDAHAERRARALAATGRTLAAIREDLDRLDAEWDRLAAALRREADGRAHEDAVLRALARVSS